jgi:hypothetical protein
MSHKYQQLIAAEDDSTVSLPPTATLTDLISAYAETLNEYYSSQCSQNRDRTFEAARSNLDRAVKVYGSTAVHDELLRLTEYPGPARSHMIADLLRLHGPIKDGNLGVGTIKA